MIHQIVITERTPTADTKRNIVQEKVYLPIFILELSLPNDPMSFGTKITN